MLSFRAIIFRWNLLLFTLLIPGGNLYAHDPALTYIRIKIEPRKVLIDCVLPVDHLNEAVHQPLFESDTATWKNYFFQNFYATNNVEPSLPLKLKIIPMAEINSYSFVFEMNCMQPIEQLIITCNLFLDICAVHSSMVDIILFDRTFQTVLSHEQNRLEIPVTTLLSQWGIKPFKNDSLNRLPKKIKRVSKVTTDPPNKNAITPGIIFGDTHPKTIQERRKSNKDPIVEDSAYGQPIVLRPKPSILHESTILNKGVRFFVLGIKHIWTGYDHLLFLAGLLLIAISFRGIVWIVTSFTVAHSATLIMSALGIFCISPRITEPLIALSVAYIAFENVLFSKKQRTGLLPLRNTFVENYDERGQGGNGACPLTQNAGSLLFCSD